MLPSNRLKFGYVYSRQNISDISRPAGFRLPRKEMYDAFKKPELIQDEKADKEQEGGALLHTIGTLCRAKMPEYHQHSPPKIHKRILKEKDFICSKLTQEQRPNNLKDAMGLINLKMTGRGVSLSGSGLNVPGGGLNVPGGGVSGSDVCLSGSGPQMLPGDMLKLKLLKNISKKKSSVLEHKQSRGGGIGRRSLDEPMTGNGGTLTGSGKTSDWLKKLVRTTSTVLFPEIVKKLQLGKGLQGAGLKSLSKLLKIKFKKVLPKTKTIKTIGRHLMPVAKEGSKVLFPILLKMASKGPTKLAGGGIHDKLKVLLARELHTGLKNLHGKGIKGAGLFGKSGHWWKNFGRSFAKGFKKVAKPGAQILGVAATAMGAPEVGIPLGLASELL